MKSYPIPSDIPFPSSKAINAGVITCLYEHGNLRYIKYGGKMVLQMIYTAVRNEHWTTFPYSISNEKVTEENNEYNISYTALYELGEAKYTADITIAINEHSISYKMQGKALSSFKKNRIGICVLHPISECAGTSALITQPDGTEYMADFPVLIKPHQPFTEIQGMKVTTHEGVTATLAFAGDVFETEDQRNWSDNSYKTYSTRLTEPMPVQIDSGDHMEQQVVIKFSNAKTMIPVRKRKESAKRRRFPKIGYVQSEDHILSAEEIGLLKKLPFDHYRINLRLSNTRWNEQLHLAVKHAAELNTKIELATSFSKNILPELDRLVQAIEPYEQLIDSILILEENQKLITRDLYTTAYNYLRAELPKLKLGYATDGFFVEINRNPPHGLQYDFISFSLTPQAHATDTRSILENLESHQYILSTARMLVGEKDIHVSPLMFSAGPEQDERQQSSFGSYWILKSFYNLSPAAITLFATGPHGILKNQGSALFNLLSTIGKMKPNWIWVEEGEVLISE